MIFEKKSSNIKFNVNPFIGGPICSMRTDRRTEMTKANSRFSQFCEGV